MSENDFKYLKLSPKQLTAVAAMIQTGDRQQAAKQAGVSLKTMQRWMRDSNFLAEIQHQQQQIMKNCRAKLAEQSTRSLDTLCQLRDDTSTPASVRLRAAAELLKLALGDDLERRLAEIERAFAELGDTIR